jgi:hypothetical protein
MTVISIKPVRECNGCALNLGKRCGIFDHPTLKWKNRKCEGYNNPMFIQHYEKLLKPDGARARKVVRKTKAKNRRTADHRDGVHRLSGRR